MMKKVFVILLAVAQLFTLVSCSRGEAGSAEDIVLVATTTAPSIELSTAESIPSESTEGLTEDEAPSEATESTEPSETQPTVEQPTETEAEPSVEVTEPSTQASTQPSTTAPTEPPHQHSYSAAQIAATCENDGYTLYSCSCGKSYSDNYTAALGHTYNDTVIAPTSSTQGYTEHTCSRCGSSYKDSYTEPVKVRYSAAEAQQIGNNYIASIGGVVTESLIWADVHGYYPPRSIAGYELDIVGGQSWLNEHAVGKVQDTVTRLAHTRPNGDFTGARMFCSVTYDEASDTYTICVYYG